MGSQPPAGGHPPCGPTGRCRPWSGAALLGALLGVLALAGVAGMAGGEQPELEAPGLRVPLQCQLGKGPWQDCLMDVEAVGLHWWLQIGSERIEFRHDGRGNIRMRQGLQAWRSVRSHWSREAALCWNGLCAKGEIPLD